MCYFLARVLLADRLQSFVFRKYPRVKTLGRAIDEGGFRTVLAIRLSPTPQFLKSYGLAVIGVPFFQFAAAGIVAGVPGSIVWAMLGRVSELRY